MEEVERKPVERAIAARLIASGKLDQAALDRILRLQSGNDERLESLLVKLGIASERNGDANPRDGASPHRCASLHRYLSRHFVSGRSIPRVSSSEN